MTSRLLSKLTLLSTLLLFALLLCLPFAKAKALTVVSNNHLWQKYELQSNVPTPGGSIQVVDGPCPAQGLSDVAAGCFASDGNQRTIFIAPDTDKDELKTTFYHEMGHLFDELHMTEADRKEFAKIVGIDPSTNWFDSQYELNEKFAVAYALAAQYGDKEYRDLYPKTKKPKVSKNKWLYKKRLVDWRERQKEYRQFKTQGVVWEHHYRATPKINQEVYCLLYNIASR